MAVQQKEDRGPEGEACGGEESGQLREEQGDAQKEKLEDRAHLEDKGFKDAMKLLDGNYSQIFELPKI